MPPSRTTTFSVLDPTSPLGRELAEGIARSLPDVGLRWFHTRADDESLIVEIAGGAALVPPLSDPDELSGSSAVVVTQRPERGVADRLLAWLSRNRDVALLDCSQPGIAPRESRCVADRPPAGGAGAPWVHLADPSLAAPVRFVAALGSLEPRALHLTVICPVAPLGEGALDELAQQGAARLSGQRVKRPHLLPAPLAFDLSPAPPERVALLEAQLGELLPGVRSMVHAVDAGVFHGTMATLLVRCAAAPTEERVRGLVRAAGGFRMARRDEVLTTTAAVEHGASITCTGVRLAGEWVAASLLADGLAVGGAGAALEIARSLSGR